MEITEILVDQNGFPAEMFQVLDPEGNVVHQNLLDLVSKEQLVDFYKWMVKIRIADRRAINLQRTGQMGTYPSVYGQEACQVGSGLGLEKEDWLVPTFRETGTMWCFGVPLYQTLLYWMGNETGSKMPEDVNCLPIAITVGGHLPHAMGIAWANKRQNKPGAVLCSFGDGATSEGDFHSALNFAGQMQTANVFFCQNNGFAISTPRSIQTAAKSIAQKAFSYGIKAIQVDGNDVVAVYLAVKQALKEAKENHTPVLIEAVTYRLGDHTTVDNSKLYRADDEVTEMQRREPIARLKKYIEATGLWDEAKEAQLLEECKKGVDEIAEKALTHAKLDPKNMFTMMYAEMTPALQKQHDEFLKQ